MNVTDATFLHNFGRAITLSGVRIANVSIAKCVFSNNSATLVGGALLFDDFVELFLRLIDSIFTNNRARNGGSAAYLTAGSSRLVLILVRSVLFIGNVLHEPEFVGDFPNGGALSIFMDEGCLNVLLEKVSFISNKAARGSSTLHSEGYLQDITIVDSSFVGNSQDESYYNDWKILLINSYILNFTVIGTVISGNYAKPGADNYTLTGQPIQFLVLGLFLALINITGLQYKSNKGGGMKIQLGMGKNVTDNSIFYLKDSRFENNEYFSLEVKAMSDSTLQMKRLVFRGNTFLSSTLQCIAMFFLFVSAEGNQITLEEATFESNTNVQGRIVLLRLPPDRKDPDACDIPKWVYKNYVRFTKVRFCKNNSTTLRLENGRNILSDCQFHNNFGRGIGSSLFIGEGSASLELSNTSFETQWSPFRGFIYVGSAGPINLVNTHLSVEAFQDIDSYLIVAASSTAYIDNNSVIRCPVGTLHMVLNVSHSHFVEAEACPNGLYITKFQSFTFSCKRCSSGFYSVDPFEETCRPCPYSGNCTIKIAARPTFWGFPSLSDRGSVNFQRCPVDYCCPYRNIS